MFVGGGILLFDASLSLMRPESRGTLDGLELGSLSIGFRERFCESRLDLPLPVPYCGPFIRSFLACIPDLGFMLCTIDRELFSMLSFLKSSTSFLGVGPLTTYFSRSNDGGFSDSSDSSGDSGLPGEARGASGNHGVSQQRSNVSLWNMDNDVTQ